MLSAVSFEHQVYCHEVTVLHVPLGSPGRQQSCAETVPYTCCPLAVIVSHKVVKVKIKVTVPCKLQALVTCIFELQMILLMWYTRTSHSATEEIIL